MSAAGAPIQVRQARGSEVEAAGQVAARGYLADDLASDRYAGMLRDARARADVALLLVALDVDGAVLGTVTYVRPGSPMDDLQHRDPEAVQLRMLAVDPEARGRGIARTLVQECLHLARADGARRMLLSTRPDMHAAQRLYASLGFTRRPDLDWRPEPDVQLLGLGLDLQVPEQGDGTGLGRDAPDAAAAGPTPSATAPPQTAV